MQVSRCSRATLQSYGCIWATGGGARLGPEIRDAIGALYGAGHTIVERSRLVV